MSGDHGLSDLRFVGYENTALAKQIEGLRNGSGTETLQDAMIALVKLGLGLHEVDMTLREQLAAIRVHWQGEAADGGTAATEGAAIYAEEAHDPTMISARGVGTGVETFHTTKNSAPEAGTLRGPTELSGFDQFADTFLGHTTDHAEKVQATNAARAQAVDALNGYQSNSSDALGQAQTLPVPPGLNLVAQPVDYGTTTAAVATYNPNAGPGPAGANLVPGGSTNAVPPGGGSGGGLPPVPPGGGRGDVLPPRGPLVGPGPLPGPGLPGGANNPLQPALRGVNPLLMAEAATMMGAGGASGAGAGAERDRVTRGGGAGGGAGGAKSAVKGATPLGAAPEDEARAARNAERFGAKTGRAPGSILQPAAAAAGRGAEGEDDQEHVRRYGIDSGDVFDDDRVVAPESIGDDDDDR